jgi:hypothetical protein
VPPQSDVRDGAVAFLLEHGADDIEHLNTSLFEHLLGVERLLTQWGQREELTLAGLCHATYGTDGFAPKLLDIGDREKLRAIVGGSTEAIVYFYASCDRAVVYPQLGTSESVSFRDRFDGTTSVPGAGALGDFVDLTIANEVEIADSSPGGAKQWTWLADFCTQTKALARPSVYAPAAQILGMAPLTPSVLPCSEKP